MIRGVGKLPLEAPRKAKRAGQKPLLDKRNIHSPLTEEFCVDTQLREEVEKNHQRSNWGLAEKRYYYYYYYSFIYFFAMPT